MAEAVHISGRACEKTGEQGVYIFHIEMKNIRPANDIAR